MSDTPRTDELMAKLKNCCASFELFCEEVEAFSAAQERELNAAKELIREIRDNEVNAVDEATKFLRDYPIK